VTQHLIKNMVMIFLHYINLMIEKAEEEEEWSRNDIEDDIEL